MQEQPVFLMSTGRSGSTLVQRLLNCHPDLVMWGEHHGFLGGLGHTFNRLFIEDGQNPFPREATGNPGLAQLLPTLHDPSAEVEWANPYTAEEFAGQLRGFISGYFGSRLPEGVRWGFKEIRYHQHGQFEMLRVLYPAGRFIFLRRNPLKVARSKLIAWSADGLGDDAPLAERIGSIRESIARIRRQYTIYGEFVQTFPEISMLVDFETLTAEPRVVVSQLLERLSLDPARYDWALAERVWSRRISSTLNR
jgi:hypothetical protein